MPRRASRHDFQVLAPVAEHYGHPLVSWLDAAPKSEPLFDIPFHLTWWQHAGHALALAYALLMEIRAATCGGAGVLKPPPTPPRLFEENKAPEPRRSCGGGGCTVRGRVASIPSMCVSRDDVVEASSSSP